MLLYDGILNQVSGTASYLTPTELASFERQAKAAGLPYSRGGSKLVFKLKPR
jgi:hypothetical protein